MIAYFALLSFVPLLFLSLALLSSIAPGQSGIPLRAGAVADVPEHVARLDPRRGARDPEECRRARNRRRRVPAGGPSLSLFSVLEERVQHRLRPPEPRLPAREGTRDGDDGRLARRALRLARDRVGRTGNPQALPRVRGKCDFGAGRGDRHVDARRAAVPDDGLLRPHERRRDAARGAARRGRGDHRNYQGHVPDAPRSMSTCRSTTR